MYKSQKVTTVLKERQSPKKTRNEEANRSWILKVGKNKEEVTTMFRLESQGAGRVLRKSVPNSIPVA